MVLGAALLLSGGCGYKNPPVPPESVVPKAIEDLRYTTQEDGVRLTWSYPLETISGKDVQEISSFDLYRAEIALDDYCATCPVPYTDPIEVNGGVTVVEGAQRKATYDHGMLRSGHKYFFKVQARTSWWASSADSNVVTFVWHTFAAAPTALTASANDSYVSLSWQPVTTLRDGSPVGAPVRYQVLRSTSGSEFTPIGSTVTDTGFKDRQVKNGEEYRYQVQSQTLFGDDIVAGGASETVTASPLDTTPPPVPTGVMAIQTGSGIRVIWDSSMDDDISGYRVYRRTAGSDYTLLGNASPSTTTYMDKTAKADATYYYAVTALDNIVPPNESSRSKDATLRH
jgi:fibronectin type 3 domain-containing protein